MKGMKGRLLRKVQSISTISSLKQGLVFHVNPSNQNFPTSPVKLLNRVKDEEMEAELIHRDREALRPSIKSTDMEETKYNDEVNKVELENEVLGFEEKCPPGGSESVILYTTSLRGIRKTFEDCNAIRFLLESLKVWFYERDVSMHLEFREELWRVLGGRVVPPRLFVKGRHIGGADEVVGLHEQGKLKNVLQGIPLNLSNSPCNVCAGIRFTVCSNCSGSCRVEQANEFSITCPDCNENGLVKCPLCS